jgi:GNAT superfamily N-acetyltransferase
MEFHHIKLADIEPGIIYDALCTSYKGWVEYPKQEGDWYQFDKDIYNNPDTIGSSGFGTILGEVLVGFISWDPRQFPSYVIIGHNCVLPKYQNRGIGKHQIASALTKFQAMGFRSASVSTSSDQFFAGARKMYESCGFVECSTYRNDVEDMIYYSIELKNLTGVR